MTVVDVKTPPPAGRQLKSFLRDVEPFFQDRPLIYVDVGAHRGDVFGEIFQSPLRPKRAYLVEPNPIAFARLQETVAALEAGTVATCFNLALGDAAGVLTLLDDDTMTRVAREGSAVEGARFEIPARTLDALAGEFITRHVSLLKIDVEGYEAEVLAGADGLLSEQAVEMIYIEAGMDPDNPRLTYYRTIEDRLAGHGYRLFRLYEQKNEWLDDSPLLRRVNMAFMSRRFAESNPLRLSKELFALRQKHATLEDRLAERERALEAARAEAKAAEGLRRQLAERERALEAARAEAKAAAAAEAAGAAAAKAAAKTAAALEARLAERDRDLAAERARLGEVTARLGALESYGRTLEARHVGMLESRSWRALEPARRVARLVTGKKPPAPFAPRLTGTPAAKPKGGPPAAAGTAAKPPAGGLSPEAARRRGESLVALAGRRDYPALLAQETALAGQAADPAFFLARFARLLALKRLSAFTEAAAATDAIEARLGRRHDWLLATFGEPVFVRYLVDATTALTRVGRYPEARGLIDAALDRLDGAPALRLQRAEMAWPYDPGQARADLAACRQRGALEAGPGLLEAWLAMQAGAALPAVDHPQGTLVAAEAARRAGDFAGFRDRLNGYFAAQGLAAPLAAGAPGFGFGDLVRPEPGRRDGPLVSVVMTTFNSADTLDYALGSLRAQSHGNLEILVVDDGSTDGTRDRLAAAAAADPRIRVLVNAENVGTYVAKNRAIAEAAGTYVTLHDSDDWAHPERIARHVAAMEAAPALGAGRSEWLRLQADGALHFRRWGCKLQHPNPASTFFRRAILERVGFFDSVRYGADSEFWFRLNRVLPGQVKSLPLCLGLGLMRAESLTQSGSGAMDAENYAPTRGAYAASYLGWHATATPAALKLPPRLAARPFWAPPEMVVPGPDGSTAAAPGPVAPRPGAVPAAARTAPEFLFGISLASAQVSPDWARTEELLGHTLRSLLHQSDPRFSVVICGHERPQLAELADPRVLFVESDQAPPKNPTGFRGDKMRKRRIVGSILRERGGGYFFPLDADDLVHRDVVAHTLTDDNRRGYLIETGYALDYNHRTLAPIPGAWSVSFDRSCGSSAVIWFDPEELPVTGDLDGELYFNLFQSHAYWPLVAEEFGRRLEPLPFPGGVYVVNHAQNLSFRLQRKGVRTENIVRSIAEHRVADAPGILAGAFGLQS